MPNMRPFIEQKEEEATRIARLPYLELPIQTLPFDPQSKQNDNAWSSSWPVNLWLITPDEYQQLPDGTILVSITATTHIKGTDNIDQDTRGGYIAFGFLESQLTQGE